MFDDLRRAHFPPARNLVPAHVSLFHNLPGGETEIIDGKLRAVCCAAAPVSMRVTGLRNLGRGVAFTLESPELAQVRSRLAEAFDAWLTPQDRQRYRPHVTVQNKVSKEEAASLLASLQAGFTPWTATGTGLALWSYLGGPWELKAKYEFQGSRGYLP